MDISLGYFITVGVLSYILLRLSRVYVYVLRGRFQSINVVLRYVSGFFTLLGTLIHELGHIYVAKLLGLRGYKIVLSMDGSGLAYTEDHKPLRRFLVTIAGYTTASIFSVIFMYSLLTINTEYVMYGFIGIIIYSLIFHVRNVYGVVWCLVVVGSFVYGYLNGDTVLITNVCKIIGIILVIDALIAPFAQISSNRACKKRGEEITSDSGVVNRLTGIPIGVADFCFVTFSVICFLINVYLIVTI